MTSLVVTSALHRLLLPLLGDLPVLPDPQRDALATAFGLISGPAPNRFLVGLATITLLGHGARNRPILCVVDDMQWVDRETLDTLTFVARRLDGEGVGLIVGLRSSGDTAAGLSGIPQHRLAPMPEPDMRLLLSAAVPVPPSPHVAESGWTAQVGFVVLDAFWLCTGFRALRTVQQGHFAEYWIWMIRNFSATFAAAVLRIILVAQLAIPPRFGVQLHYKDAYNVSV